jgi:predicted ATPase
VSLSIGGAFQMHIGDDSALCERADELVALTTERDLQAWGALGTIYRGWVEVKRGDVAQGIALLRSGSNAGRASGAFLWRPYFMTHLAIAYEIAGRIEMAITLLDDAFRTMERTGGRWIAAELNRHKGQLLLHQGHPEAAEELYRKALGVAREQEAKLWELRAAVSLARLWRDQGRRGEAHDLLAPVYGWFTEGFDTPDLREAKAVLTELARSA